MKTFYVNIPLSAKAYFLSAEAQCSKHPIVIFTTSAQEAHDFEHACHFFAPTLECFIFPSWETLAYDHFSPHESIISERLSAFKKLPHLKNAIVIVQIATLLQRVAPTDYLNHYIFSLKVGHKIDREKLRFQLTNAGYHSVNQVSLPGEYAFRGSIIDIFPTGATEPFRCDLFDDEIESIKIFDPETQLSSKNLKNFELLPAHEFPLNEEGIKLFRENFREAFTVNPTTCSVYQAISQGETPPGIEYFLPLFFHHTVSLFDYLPKETILSYSNDLAKVIEQEWRHIEERYDQLAHDVTRPILPPKKLFLTLDEVNAALKKFTISEWVNRAPVAITSSLPVVSGAECISLDYWPLPDLLMQADTSSALAKLQFYLQQFSFEKILFCAESLGRRENLLGLLKPLFPDLKLIESWQEFFEEKKVGTYVGIAQLTEGFRYQEKWAILPEAALFGIQQTQTRRKYSKHFDTELMIRNLAELAVGNPVVHIDHGVGRYQGLEILTVGGHEAEFLKLAYDGGNLYIPVSNLHLISRYTGLDPEHAPLHRLGTDQWQKAKAKAATQVRDVAAELLNVYAVRAARKGFRYSPPDEHYYQFVATFPFEETIDQKTAIEAVIADMTSEKPMDRLICGDVGFGKTEVAMRAAFLAAQSGKQTAILVPTTLLAQQHFENFSDRFAKWPIRLDYLSRFRTPKEQQGVLEKLTTGNIDIIIGTHKLLQNHIHFSDLGLLILDEEHRFGVRQKEALKKWRVNVDVLTMTATPIPRTLNMAMADVRDLSIIATPPPKRLAIKTFIREFDWPLVREAIMRENLRGGQVYFLHNEVSTIENMAQELRTLLPEARIVVAHGQMHERELERVMADFYHQRFNVLVCSTIIETGIDVPNANTIIINRADKFGLAQLHQLRGRVGRSHHQAYAYLFTPPLKSLSSDAQQRLEAIGSLEDLGAGFMLATHDLEIRGAGQLLGEEQSGNIQGVGFSLYMELLNRTVKAMQKGTLPEEIDNLSWRSDTCELELNVPAFIPDYYLNDVNHRLIFYKKMSSAQDLISLNEIKIELIDRFGLLPPQTQNLFDQMQLKLQADALGIQRIEVSSKGGRIEFTKTPKVDGAKIIRLIQLHPHEYKMEGPTRLRFIWKKEVDAEKRIAVISALLERLS